MRRQERQDGKRQRRGRPLAVRVARLHSARSSPDGQSAPAHFHPIFHLLPLLTMASRNGRGGAASTPGGGRAPRRPTPTSPSPSPEPSSDVTRTSNSNAAFPFQQQGVASSDGSNMSTAGPSTILSSMDSAIGGSGSGSGARNGGGVPGQMPFHHVLPLEEDPNEPFRQRAEDCTRNVIDSLFQLAVCAADIQPGREDIIGTKV